MVGSYRFESFAPFAKSPEFVYSAEELLARVKKKKSLMFSTRTYRSTASISFSKSSSKVGIAPFGTEPGSTVIATDGNLNC